MYHNAQAVRTHVLPRILVKYFKGLDFNVFFAKVGRKRKKRKGKTASFSQWHGH